MHLREPPTHAAPRTQPVSAEWPGGARSRLGARVALLLLAILLPAIAAPVDADASYAGPQPIARGANAVQVRLRPHPDCSQGRPAAQIAMSPKRSAAPEKARDQQVDREGPWARTLRGVISSARSTRFFTRTRTSSRLAVARTSRSRSVSGVQRTSPRLERVAARRRGSVSAPPLRGPPAPSLS